MLFKVCDYCRNIPLDLFSNKDFVHVFHPSLKLLKSSSENGHSCYFMLRFSIRVFFSIKRELLVHFFVHY